MGIKLIFDAYDGPTVGDLDTDEPEEMIHCPAIGNDTYLNLPKVTCEFRKEDKTSSCYGGCKGATRPKYVSTPPNKTWMAKLDKLRKRKMARRTMAEQMDCSITTINKYIAVLEGGLTNGH